MSTKHTVHITNQTLNHPSIIYRAITMGGGRWFYFPTHIWTPSGGWFASPKNWKANTLVALGGIGLAALSTFSFSASLEVSSLNGMN